MDWALEQLDQALAVSMRKPDAADWGTVENVVDALVAKTGELTGFDREFHDSMARATRVLHDVGRTHLARGLESGARGELEAAARYLAQAVRNEEAAQGWLENVAQRDLLSLGLSRLYGSTLRAHACLHELGQAQVSLERWPEAKKTIRSARSHALRLPEQQVKATALTQLLYGRAPKIGWVQRRVYSAVVRLHDKNLEAVDAALRLRVRDGAASIDAALSSREQRKQVKKVTALTKRSERLSPSTRRHVKAEGLNPWRTPGRGGRAVG